MNNLNLTEKEKHTFKIHIIYSILDGIIIGVFALNEFVLIKSLKGTNYQIGFLFQFSIIVMILSIFFNEILKRTQNKVKLIKILTIITRLPLLALLFFPHNTESNNLFYQGLFLFIFLIYSLAVPIISPTINLFLKNSYSQENFGKLYGYATTASKIVMLVSTFLFGILLDINNYLYTYTYPFIAVISIISIYYLLKIDYKDKSNIVLSKNYWHAVIDSFSNMYKVLKNNKPYLHFEIGFMFYGLAWMISAAVIAIFLDKALQLNYSSIAFYKNSYNTIAIFLLPFFGKLIGKIDPRKFAAITFSALLLFLFFMGLTEYVPYYFNIFGLKIYYTLIISYIFYGVFTATMSLLWFIGSAYFCKDKEAGFYQSIHLTLTGLRGSVAPIFGVFFYNIFDFSGVFGLGIFSLLLAIVLMIWSMKYNNKV